MPAGFLGLLFSVRTATATSPFCGFTAANAVGVVQFDRTGSVFMLAGESRLGIAPDGHSLIGWGEDGARLYSPQGFRLQTLTDQSVSALVWQEDAKGFLLLQEDGLFHFQFPLLQARLVTTDVWRGDEKAFVWLR